LGFRRDAAVSLSTNKPYKFEKALRFGLQDIVPYREQVRILVQQGFCLWDVVQSCVRPGSLDVDIKQEVPNDIRTFCETHPSIRRIVLANGGTASAMFKKHFKEWWESGHLQAGSDAMSQAAFGKQSQKAKKKTSVMDDRVITCICAISVSPAAAKYSYEQKRDFWDLHIYKPGLTERQRLTNPIKFD
jgi:hypoxanthine-DNA glycosylase